MVNNKTNWRTYNLCIRRCCSMASTRIDKAL